MDIIFITIPITLVLVAVALKIFFWASKSGQFDDLEGPAHSILFDDDMKKTVTKPTTKQQDNEQPLD
jgi:cbb3-type cytochrome oxidase maturation protein